VAGTCEYSNEPSSSIKCGEIPDELRTGLLPKKDSAPFSKEDYTINIQFHESTFMVTTLICKQFIKVCE